MARDNPMKAEPKDSRREYECGYANPEHSINSINNMDSLRQAMCANCAEKELSEMAIGNGLNTVVKCSNCGERYET
jgi:transcription elongation factor Elf1